MNKRVSPRKNNYISSLSIVFPAYNDANSLPRILYKVIELAPKITKKYEIIVVNDGSKDNTYQVLKKLKNSIPALRIINHKKNRGYGATLADGFKNAKLDWIFYTDSDGQYDVEEIVKLVKKIDKSVDLVNGYKIKRSDIWLRKLIGAAYNQFVRFIFRLKIRDIDCDFRIFRRSIIEEIEFNVTSGAFGAEFVTKLQDRNIRLKEVPVHHYPREFGASQFFRIGRIAKSIWDLSIFFLSRMLSPISLLFLFFFFVT